MAERLEFGVEIQTDQGVANLRRFTDELERSGKEAERVSRQYLILQQAIGSVRSPAAGADQAASAFNRLQQSLEATGRSTSRAEQGLGRVHEELVATQSAAEGDALGRFRDELGGAAQAATQTGTSLTTLHQALGATQTAAEAGGLSQLSIDLGSTSEAATTTGASLGTLQEAVGATQTAAQTASVAFKGLEKAADIQPETSGLERFASILKTVAQLSHIPGLEDLERQFSRTKKAIDRLEPSLDGLGAATASAGGRFSSAAVGVGVLVAALLAAAAATASWVKATRDATALGASMLEFARRVGAPVEELEKLRFAAEQAGVSLESLAPTFRGITQALSDAGRQGSEARQVFEDLGLADELERIKKLSPVEQFLTIGNAFNQYADDANKAADAQIAFGRGAFASMQLLRDPSLAKNLERQSRLTEEFAERSDRLDDALGELSASWTDLKIAIADTGALDVVISLFETLARVVGGIPEAVNKTANALKFGLNLFLTGPGTIGQREDAAGERQLNTPLSAHEGGPTTVSALRRFIEATKASLPDIDKPGSNDAANDFLKKLAQLRAEVEAGVNPIARFNAEVDRQAEAMLGGAKATAAQRAELKGLVATNLRTEALKDLGQTIRDLADDLLAVRDPSAAAAVATRQLAEDLEAKLGVSLEGILSTLPQLPPEAAAAEEALNKLADAIQRGLSPAAIEAAAEGVVTAIQKIPEAVQQARVGELFTSYERELRVFHGEITESQAAVEELTESLKLAGAQQGPRGELLEDYARSVITARQELEGFFDVFDALGEGWNRFLTSIGEGTLEWEEIGKSIKASLLRNFSEAFAGAWKEKLGFEGAFKVNLVQFLGNVGGLIRGQTGGQGILGTLFGGVLGGNGGGLVSQLGSSLFSGSGGSSSFFGSSFSSFPTSPITNPLLSRLSSFFGLSGAGQALGSINLPPTFVGPPHVLPSTFVGPPGPGEATLAGQSGSLLGNLAGLVAAIGAIYSLAKTIQGLGETFKAFKAVTFNDKSANQNFRAVSTMGLIGGAVGGAAAGAGIGAATGFLGGGPFGLVVGALVGAAVGAAVSKAISDSVAKAVGGSVSEQVKRGGTQADLDQSIKDSLSGNVLLNVLSGFSNTVLSQLIGGLLAPNIETIFDKLFSSVLQKLNFPVNRQLTERGQGVPAQVRQVTVAPTGERTVTRISGRDELRQLAPLRGDAGILATILAGQIGAGTENAERIERFTNILINSLARLGKTFDQAEAVIFRTLRNASGGRFTTALDLVDQTFPVPTARREDRLAERAAAARDRQQDRLADRLERQQDRAEQRREKAQERFDKGTAFAVRSFEPILPGVDLAKFAEFFQQEDFGQRALKTSRKATREALPELFGKESFEQGVGDFQASLAGAVREAFQEGIAKAVLKPLLDQIFAPVFAEINEGAKRLRRQGFTPENIERFTSDVQQRVTESVQLLADPGLQSILEQLVEADRKLTEALRDNQIQLALANGRRVEAVSLALQALPPVGVGSEDDQIRQLILDRLEPLRQAVEHFAALAEAARDFAENLRLRALPFINGELGNQAQRTRERERAFERSAAVGVGFGPGGFTLDLEKVNRDPETAFARFQEAAGLYVDELVAGIEAGRRATALKSNVRIDTALALGRGPGADQARVDAFRLARQDTGARLAGAGITFGEDGGLSIDMTKVTGDVALAESLLEEYGRLRLEEMQTELEALKAQKAFAEQVHRFFVGPGGILSQIDVLRSGKRGQERTLEQLVNENVSLRPAALAGDEDAQRKIQENYSQGLVLAQSLYAPGSAEFAHYLDLFEAGAKEFGAAFELDPALDSKIAVLEGAIVTFGDNMIAAATAIEDATKDLPAALETFVSAAEAAALQFEGIFLAKRDEAQLRLQAEFTRIVDALAPLGIANGILTDIARDLGLFLDLAATPPVTTTPPVTQPGPGEPGGPPWIDIPPIAPPAWNPDGPPGPTRPSIPPNLPGTIDTGVHVVDPFAPPPPGHFVPPIVTTPPPLRDLPLVGGDRTDSGIPTPTIPVQPPFPSPGVIVTPPGPPPPPAHFTPPPARDALNVGFWKPPWADTGAQWFYRFDDFSFDAVRKSGTNNVKPGETHYERIKEHFAFALPSAAGPSTLSPVAPPLAVPTSSGGGAAPTIGVGAAVASAGSLPVAGAVAAATGAISIAGGAIAATPALPLTPALPQTGAGGIIAGGATTAPALPTSAIDTLRESLSTYTTHVVGATQALTEATQSLPAELATALSHLEIVASLPTGAQIPTAIPQVGAAPPAQVGAVVKPSLVGTTLAGGLLPGATVTPARPPAPIAPPLVAAPPTTTIRPPVIVPPPVVIPPPVTVIPPPLVVVPPPVVVVHAGGGASAGGSAPAGFTPAVQRARVVDLGAFRAAREGDDALGRVQRHDTVRRAPLAAAAGLALALLGSAGPVAARAQIGGFEGVQQGQGVEMLALHPRARIHRATEAPAIVHDVLASPGAPLPGPVRRDMERRFGQSFSAVRVHTDARAGRSASAIQALAYTVGPHIAFAAGRFQPDTPMGQALLAHELAHVVQQGPTSPVSRLTVGAADSPVEREADQMAAVALRRVAVERGLESAPEAMDAGRLHHAVEIGRLAAVRTDGPIARPEPGPLHRQERLAQPLHLGEQRTHIVARATQAPVGILQAQRTWEEGAPVLRRALADRIEVLPRHGLLREERRAAFHGLGGVTDDAPVVARHLVPAMLVQRRLAQHLPRGLHVALADTHETVLRRLPRRPGVGMTAGADQLLERSHHDGFAFLARHADEVVAPIRARFTDEPQTLHLAPASEQQSVPLAGLQVVASDSTTTGGASARATPPTTKSEQNIEVHMGPFEFRIDGTQTPEETARQCADVIRKRTFPALNAEIRRAASS